MTLIALLSIAVVSLLSSGVHSYGDSSMETALLGGNDDYQDAMLQELYKRLSQLDQGYYRGEDEDDDQGNDLPVARDRTDRTTGQADIRDSEYLGHSSSEAQSAYIHVSGGAGEGTQHLNPEGMYENIHQVKSDEALPFYCHPPNPCPKGFTKENGCQEYIDDTAEAQRRWIGEMQARGLCKCDEEHMINCPKVSASKDYPTADEAMGDMVSTDDFVKEYLNNDHWSSNPYSGGQKRQTLVAKKSPRIKRGASNDQMESELTKLAHGKRARNPYLAGERLRTVAKKGNMKG